MLRNTAILLFLAFSALISLGNKNGRASQAQRGNTGAPGDETQGGQPLTCMGCHNTGPIVASVAIHVLNAAGDTVSQYVPGQAYTARVTINASGPNLQGYGFQMIALRDSDNADLKAFSDVNPNNYKIATIPNGRKYAEHDNISTINTFDVTWTAPPAGTGNVTFYASGNGVNKNGTTSGDGAGVSSKTLSEAGTSLVAEWVEPVACLALPNPAQHDFLLRLTPATAGDFAFKAFNMGGQLVWQEQFSLPSGLSEISVPAENWAKGAYVIAIEGSQSTTNVKVLKL
jgi:hypothetical protein